MKKQSRGIVNKLDKEVFGKLGHSWACKKEIKDCMCEGGTLWNEIVRPLVKKNAYCKEK